MPNLKNKPLLEKLLKLSPFIALVIGVSFAAFVAWQIHLDENDKEQLRFELACKQTEVLIKNRMATYEQVLRSGIGLFQASENVSRSEWAAFSKAQNLNEKFKGIQGFGYAEVVLPRDKKAHEERIKKEGFPNYSIKPDGQRALYTAIIYLEPFDERNKKAFGFDMFSEKTRQEAMRQAMESGKAVLSGKVKLVQENDKDVQVGFLMYLPVYKKGVALDTVQERIAGIQGFVHAPFRVNDLMNGVLGVRYIALDFELYDGTTKDSSAQLYDSKPTNNTSKLVSETKLTINGRTWTLVFKTTEKFIAEKNTKMPLYTFCLGSTLSLLLFALLNLLLRVKEKANNIAREKTVKLAKSEAEIRSILQAMTEGVIVRNAKGEITECNMAAQEILRLSRDEMISAENEDHEWQTIKDDGSHFSTNEYPFMMAMSTKEAQRNVIMGFTKPNTPTKWVLVNSEPILSDDFESVAAVVTTLSDITEYRKSKKELERYVEMINANIITSTTDKSGKILSVSEAFCAISGYSREELLGHDHNIVRHKDVPKSLYEELWETILSGRTWHGEIKNMRKDGSDYWVHAHISPQRDDTGEIVGFVAVRQDISDKKIIEELCVTDRLTQLYNRLKLDEIFAFQLHTAKRYGIPFSLIMLDLDKFKSVNDTYGHQAGDEVLKELAHILKTSVREVDTVGRWGGEEFLILTPNTELKNAVALAEKLRELISAFTFSFAGHKTGSFGVSTYTPGDDEKSMVGRADEALYRAKENGRNQVVAG